MVSHHSGPVVAKQHSSTEHLKRNLDLLIQPLIIAGFGPPTAFRTFPFQGKSDDLPFVVIGNIQNSNNNPRGHQIGKEVAVL